MVTPKKKIAKKKQLLLLESLAYDLLKEFLTTQLRFNNKLKVSFQDLYRAYLEFVYYHELSSDILAEAFKLFENKQSLHFEKNGTRLSTSFFEYLSTVKQTDMPKGILSRRRFSSAVASIFEEIEKEVTLYRSAALQLRGAGLNNSKNYSKKNN